MADQPEAFFASLLNQPTAANVKRRGSVAAADAVAWSQEESQVLCERIDILESLAAAEAQAVDAEKARTAEALAALESSIQRLQVEAAEREAARDVMQQKALSQWMAEAEATWQRQMDQATEAHHVTVCRTTLFALPPLFDSSAP